MAPSSSNASSTDKPRTNTSPFSLLPTELIVKVLKSTFHHPFLLSRHDRRHFLLMRQVCMLWRNVAYDTPELWRGLMIDWDDVSYLGAGLRPMQAVVDTLARWYNRAGAHSLALSINLSFQTPKMTLDLNYFISFIKTRKWTYLNFIDLPPELLSDLITQWGVVTCPTRVLAINCETSRGNPYRTTPEGRFELSPPLSDTFPNLVTLFLDYVQIPPFQHPSLTSLHLGPSSYLSDPQSFAATISPASLPQLEELILGGFRKGFARDYLGILDMRTVVHPSVRRVVVKGVEAAYALQWLELPALDFLRIEAVSEASVGGSVKLVKVVQDLAGILADLMSGPMSCQTLSLDDFGMESAENYSTFFSKLKPGIQRLHIEDYTIFGALDLSTSPALKHLETIVCTDTLYSGGTLPNHIDDLVKWLSLRRVQPGEVEKRITIYEYPWDKGISQRAKERMKPKYEGAAMLARQEGADIVFVETAESIYDMVDYPLNSDRYHLPSAGDRNYHSR
ncbi:hypothetical protein FA15DRAFT_669116 [Coprinopsis marcescibilis]|uniref:Uncharacterized protein n=1 Tax=Coprinopsis marcescibilis TaxID=230819 RepID=A0A5C3KWT2_COPMA|nr:hypothetical protein FA15DRAFT_669116 [Coprinopsis marcescibilis]